MIAGEQNPLTFLGREAMGNMAAAALTAILTVPITQKALAPALEGAQADADLAAGADQARTSGMGLADQLDRIAFWRWEARVSLPRPPSRRPPTFFAASTKLRLPPTPSPCPSAPSALSLSEPGCVAPLIGPIERGEAHPVSIILAILLGPSLVLFGRSVGSSIYAIVLRLFS